MAESSQGSDYPVHPVERQRVAEAARIFAYGQDLSPQAFAERILRHRHVRLRHMRDGVRAISRRAIANLIGNKRVREPTIHAVRDFICAEKGLPAHLFQVDPRMIAAAKAETALRVEGILPHASYRRFVRKYSIMQAETHFSFWFQIEYDSTDRVLLVRGVIRAGTSPDYDWSERVFVSGYAVPSGPVLTMTLTDYHTPGRHLIDLSTADLLQIPFLRRDPQGRTITHHSPRLARIMFPAEHDPASSWIIPNDSKHVSVLTRSLEPMRKGDFSLMWWTHDADQLGIGGMRYLNRDKVGTIL